MGKLAYTVPSISDLFGGVPISNFNQHYIGNANDEAISFELKVQNVPDSTVVTCEDG